MHTILILQIYSDIFFSASFCSLFSSNMNQRFKQKKTHIQEYGSLKQYGFNLFCMMILFLIILPAISNTTNISRWLPQTTQWFRQSRKN